MNGMTQVSGNGMVRPYRPSDYRSVRDIYIATGYVGSALKPEAFSDTALFAMFYLDHYCAAYRDHFFVYDQNGAVQGYINGAPDTEEFNAHYRKYQIPRIYKRLTTLTSLTERERSIAGTVIDSYRTNSDVKADAAASADTDTSTDAAANADTNANTAAADSFSRIVARYPAHLHINVSPNAQRIGIGGRLLQHYEQHCRARSITAIHLGTSTYNIRALPFYERHGYRLIHRTDSSLWPELTDCAAVVYAKRL